MRPSPPPQISPPSPIPSTDNPPAQSPDDPCSGNSCSIQIRDQARDNGNKLDLLLRKLDLIFTGIDLGLLALINTKLGPLLPRGGLSGKLSRMSRWLQLDRVWNILTYAAVLHNAWMLSNSFGQTLLSATSSFLAAVGVTDEDGSPLDVGNLIGKSIKDTAESIFGKSTVGNFETQYKKYIRVYQACANILNSFTSIGYSILSVLEIVGSRISKIGNALRWYGVVSDRAYAAMNEADNFQNPLFNRITRLEEAASNIDTVSSEVVNVRQQSKELVQQKKELDKALKEVIDKEDKTTKKEDEQIKKNTPDIKEADVE